MKQINQIRSHSIVELMLQLSFNQKRNQSLLMVDSRPPEILGFIIIIFLNRKRRKRDQSQAEGFRASFFPTETSLTFQQKKTFPFRKLIRVPFHLCFFQLPVRKGLRLLFNSYYQTETIDYIFRKTQIVFQYASKDSNNGPLQIP